MLCDYRSQHVLSPPPPPGAHAPLLLHPLTSPLLPPDTSLNRLRLLPMVTDTCSAASNPGPTPIQSPGPPGATAVSCATSGLPSVPKAIPSSLTTAATLCRAPSLRPVPGRAGKRHRQLCAILCPGILLSPRAGEQQSGAEGGEKAALEPAHSTTRLRLLHRALWEVQGPGPG